MESDLYIGEWELIPELCVYEQGSAPRSGTYSISDVAGITTIFIDWTDQAGEEHHIEYAGPADGSSQPTEAPGLTRMTLTRISENTLDSAAYNGDDEILYARRTAHGDLLSTYQRTYVGGERTSIFQVYRRAAA